MARYSEIVKVKREELKLTQNELAKEAGISVSTLSKFENGEKVSEVVVKSIRYALRKLGDELNGRDKYNYDLIATAKLVPSENDPEQIKKRLHNVMSSCLRYIRYLEN